MQTVRRDAKLSARLQLAFELYDLAERMMRTKLRRQFPQASDQEIERKLLEWLSQSPPLPPGLVPAPHRFASAR